MRKILKWIYLGTFGFIALLLIISLFIPKKDIPATPSINTDNSLSDRQIEQNQIESAITSLSTIDTVKYQKGDYITISNSQQTFLKYKNDPLLNVKFTDQIARLRTKLESAMTYFYPLMRMNSIDELTNKFNPFGVKVKIEGQGSTDLILVSNKFFNSTFANKIKEEIPLIIDTWRFKTVTLKVADGLDGIVLNYNFSDTDIN